MAKHIILITLCSYILSNCSSDKHFAISGNRFSYYDLFTLKGQEPLTGKSIVYPFVVINNCNDTTFITHHISISDSFSSVYLKQNGFFERYVYNPMVADKPEIKEFIRNDSIVIINFAVVSDLSIEGIGFFSRNRFCYYTFPGPLKRDHFTIDSAITFINSLRSGSMERIDFTEAGDSVAVSRISEMLSDDSAPLVRSDQDTTTGRRINAKQNHFKNRYNSIAQWLIFSWKYYQSSFFCTSKKLEELYLNKDGR